MFLIDTNILSYFVKGNSGVENSFIKHSESIFLCSIVQSECFFGAKKANKTSLVSVYDTIFATYPVLAYDAKTAEIFIDLKVDLSNKGTIVEDFDLMIAAIALANDLTLVTANTKHFQRVEGLKVEDWSR